MPVPAATITELLVTVLNNALPPVMVVVMVAFELNYNLKS
jgi:phenylpyruvate tautomerase PptA (4-oxalocrotonate tautomerase family)